MADYITMERDGEQDNNYLVIEGTRDGYGIDQVERSTITAGELIDILSRYDANTKVVIGNDYQGRTGWYTHGTIREGTITEVEMREKKKEWCLHIEYSNGDVEDFTYSNYMKAKNLAEHYEGCSDVDGVEVYEIED